MKKLINKSLRAYVAFTLTILMLIALIPMNAIAISDEEFEEVTKTDAIVGEPETEETQSGEAETFTVIFKNDGDEYAKIAVEENGIVSKPIIDPYKEKLNFKGWYDESGNAFDFENSVISENIVLNARYYAVVNIIVLGAVVDTIYVDEGQLVPELTIPDEVGYDFITWNSNNEPYNFENPVSGNLTIIAQVKKQVGEVENQDTIFYKYVNENKLISADLSLIEKENKVFNKTGVECGYCNKEVTFGWNTLENIWFSHYGNGGFAFFEFICNECGERTLLYSSANTPTLNIDGTMGSANMMSLEIHTATIIEYKNTVQFLPGAYGTLSDDTVYNVPKGTKWNDGWVPIVTPSSTYTHIGWVEKNGYECGVNGPFLDPVDRNMEYTARYTDKSVIIIYPNNASKVFNGTDQSSDAGYSGGLSGYTIKGYVEIIGTARNVNEPGELSIGDVSNLRIYKGTEDVTDKFVIDTSITATINITPAPVIIKVDPIEIYEDEFESILELELTGTVSGLIEGEELNFEYYLKGETTLSARVLKENPNYEVTIIDAELTIKDTPIFTVTYLPGKHGAFLEDVHTGIPRGSETPVYDNGSGNPDSGTPKGEPGWTFNGWYPEVEEKVDENATYTAQWRANTNTAYTVRYMLDDGETVLSESTMHGTTGAYVSIPRKFIPGYTFDRGNESNILSGNILGDG
ncbi:MAG: InlB B-repeat-containing protein, partial [Oscillospiraceae bacterium]|nr:InlB B-repeat-containing protein [Oscillospiraceae bacterium]